MFAHVRNVARDSGVDRVFQTHGVNVIIGPADGFISTMAASSGECTTFCQTGETGVNSLTIMPL
jgi:hypothetical protein